MRQRKSGVRVCNLRGSPSSYVSVENPRRNAGILLGADGPVLDDHERRHILDNRASQQKGTVRLTLDLAAKEFWISCRYARERPSIGLAGGAKLLICTRGFLGHPTYEGSSVEPIGDSEMMSCSRRGPTLDLDDAHPIHIPAISFAPGSSSELTPFYENQDFTRRQHNIPGPTVCENPPGLREPSVRSRDLRVSPQRQSEGDTS